jgi:hypothetical protein
MGEKITIAELDPSHEIEARSVTPEKASDHEVHAATAENLTAKAEQARATAEQAAETTAAETKRIEQLEKAEKLNESTRPALISHELKAVTLQRELQNIRRRLPAPDRVLSRVIHQPAVRVISEVTGKTISRPSGLLGGGLVALLGTTGYLYTAQHMGFRYNYFVFLVLFGGGFIVGIVLELLVWLATRSRRHATE